VAELRFDESPGGETFSLWTPAAAASLIWRARPMLHLLVEAVAESAARIESAGAVEEVARDGRFLLSPGFRGGWDVGRSQLVVGAAAPIEFTAGERSVGLALYFSFETAFRADAGSRALPAPRRR
jgi:hypothetical protein